MRRTLTNEVVAVLRMLLLVAAILFGWIGSQRSAAPGAAGAVDGSTVGTHDEFQWEKIGASTDQRHCASCHQQGEATRRVSPLRNHVPSLLQADGGRTYLIDVILFGLEGRIQVDANTYDSRHPPYKDRLTDEEVAATLNYILTSWSNHERLPAGITLYVPEEVSARRRFEFSGVQVHQFREQILPAR